MQHSTKQQGTELNSSLANAEEAINSAFSETLQTREQYKDSPIWIIEKSNEKCIAVIGEYQILSEMSREDIEYELNNPTLKTYCTIISVISDKVYTLNEEVKNSNQKQ